MWLSLKVHAAEGAPYGVEGNAALHKPRIEPMLLEFSLAPGASKEAAAIGVALRQNCVNARQ
jgi:hypothetical protein